MGSMISASSIRRVFQERSTWGCREGREGVCGSVGTVWTDLICAHEIEDSFAGLGYDEVYELGEISFDEVAIGERYG